MQNGRRVAYAAYAEELQTAVTVLPMRVQMAGAGVGRAHWGKDSYAFCASVLLPAI